MAEKRYCPTCGGAVGKNGRCWRCEPTKEAQSTMDRLRRFPDTANPAVAWIKTYTGRPLTSLGIAFGCIGSVTLIAGAFLPVVGGLNFVALGRPDWIIFLLCGIVAFVFSITQVPVVLAGIGALSFIAAVVEFFFAARLGDELWQIPTGPSVLIAGSIVILAGFFARAESPTDG